MKRFTVLLLASLPLYAETARQTAIAQEMVDKGLVARANGGLASAVRPDQLTGASIIDGLVATWLLDRRGSQEELLAWMEQRTELQMGASPEVASTSSAAIKASAPRILSVAVDMGMLSRTSNGQLITFRGTPAGVAQAMFGWQVLHRPWDRLAVAATFDRSRGADGTDVMASTRQLASWSAGFEIYNGRQPRSAEWLGLLQNGESYLHAREALVAAFAQWPELRDWQADFATRLEREVDRPLSRGYVPVDQARQTAIRIALDQLDRLPVSATAAQALSKYALELHELLSGRNHLREARRTGPIVSIDWNVLRPVGGRAQWAGTAIAQTSLGKQGTDLTANWTAHSDGAARAALELTIPATTGFASLSARYGREHLTRGPFTFTAQATWTVLLSGGVRLPISLGLTRNPATGVISPQAIIGVQLATDAMAHWMR